MIILTGANMGGKSTYLRSAALCVLMAQIGSFVPADEATISAVDGIFTRVGASDQQSRGISTFMAEMLDCSSMLKQATKDSLLVVDELGRGTSTFDGFGLAYAIAEEILNKIRCSCVFATHFHEMAELAEQEGAVAMQMGVTMENNQITMLYQVRPGIAQSSFGLQVARAVHLEENVVAKAEEILAEMENRTDEEFLEKLKNADDNDLRRLILLKAEKTH
ncbi:unnamed protein product [Caenorhabditis auriculariae]|uniref:DNA mismatch repair proteins mutS family domain-containing protein n=1 Tax=Caenorhabditis auriculariae TaxID=2777116 RepID=A0A8S1GMY1_9PELO|nr:unnamed protein product [Caenorhabditis auriculariae]